MGAASKETIVITGASRGIGEAPAKRLAQPGTELLLLARSEDKLASISEELTHPKAFAHYLARDRSSIETGRAAAHKNCRTLREYRRPRAPLGDHSWATISPAPSR